ncbi:amino acid adenylation domain-containing protein/thioester reductase domain-containing protein [Chryseobacterium arachidis]|uniref:Amino acid adenylation domain-containing protein/thioester reductase domain-containing protein n=2 Tax=Chryseobacterium arachidis TaxID=1416778 RepID=A0A1M5J753_9FLAO|nr:non-ribosomal peptide synthetase [Chryseobacterium arachidis]SHG36070.1 amino acid adenylation domain-containing protein/thioester reductase domain-containing protein [Chryseobacterium arachidis]
MSNTTSTEQALTAGVAIPLSSQDKEKILHEFNSTGWDYKIDETLLSLFQKQATLFPEKPAAVFRNKEITYRELDKLSNQIANLLIKKGIKEGRYVPVWLDRSLEWIVSILGILKTGAAYVPIDHSYPAKRVEFILADTSAIVLITNSLLSSSLAETDTELFIFNTTEDLQGFNAEPAHIKIGQESLAYTIYTSGSTGNPKGVMVSHHSIQHLVTWHNEYFHVDHTSKLSLVAGLAFDISVWETWSALTSGATIYIADNEERTEASALVNYFRKNRITHGFVPTVLAPSVIEKTKSQNDLALKYLFTAGEKLKPVLTSELNYELIDYYGPTECTVYATFRKVKDANGQYVSSIGKPIANANAYILNDQLELLPVGATGELFIGGNLLAKGYLNNQQLTETKFIKSPFKENEKLYRTGDLARWTANGDIEFLGRIDNQVKIRGFRVELGEVERAIAQINGVEEASVITKDNNGDNKYLVAFVVPKDNLEKDISIIRNQLKEELPGYMIPAQIIFIDKIPLTPNGKTDTNLLKTRADEEAKELISHEPPTNDTERIIAEIWAEELERPVINITDNFFDIGGNSLLVAIAAVSLQEKLNVKVYIRDVYQYPVLRDFSNALIARAKEEREALPVEDVEPYVELQNDVYLNQGTVFEGTFDPKQLKNPKAIFLTGVTGFVGIHLLQELLDTTEADIHCLVRAQDEFHAMEKIDKCFKQFHIPRKTGQTSRIIPIVGDLALPSLGLSDQKFKELAGNLDLIYHSGSSVNFIEPYSYMKAPNVEGLREIIRLAGAEKTKCLALLSTISVYSWGHIFTGKTVMMESDDIEQNIISVSKDIGYVRSKYVMEAIADLAAKEGLPLITYRLGYAMCHSKSGASAPYQWWSGLVKNCIEFKSYPMLTELREGLITVDYMTQSMAHITKNKDAIGKKFNLIASPETNLTLEQFFDLFKQYYPFDLKGLSYKDWRKQWENDSKNRLYPLTSLFKDNMHEGLSTVELYQHTYIWDCSNVIKFLEGSGIKEPVFDKALLDSYLNYLGISVN